MASELSIINYVLNELGELAVSNVNETAHAKLLSQKLPNIIKELLSNNNWYFAQKYTQLQLTNEQPTNEFKYAYQLPFDFVRLVQVPNNIRYRVLGDKLYSYNSTNMFIYYISTQVSFNLLPIEFEKYVIYKLASESSLVLTNNVRLTEYLNEKEQEARYNAVTSNANIGYFEEVPNIYGRGRHRPL